MTSVPPLDTCLTSPGQWDFILSVSVLTSPPSLELGFDLYGQGIKSVLGGFGDNFREMDGK